MAMLRAAINYIWYKIYHIEFLQKGWGVKPAPGWGMLDDISYDIEIIL